MDEARQAAAHLLMLRDVLDRRMQGGRYLPVDPRPRRRIVPEAIPEAPRTPPVKEAKRP